MKMMTGAGQRALARSAKYSVDEITPEGWEEAGPSPCLDASSPNFECVEDRRRVW